MGIVAGHPGEAAPDGVSAITTDVYWIPHTWLGSAHRRRVKQAFLLTPSEHERILFEGGPGDVERSLTRSGFSMSPESPSSEDRRIGKTSTIFFIPFVGK